MFFFIYILPSLFIIRFHQIHSEALDHHLLGFLQNHNTVMGYRFVLLVKWCVIVVDVCCCYDTSLSFTCSYYDKNKKHKKKKETRKLIFLVRQWSCCERFCGKSITIPTRPNWSETVYDWKSKGFCFFLVCQCVCAHFSDWCIRYRFLEVGSKVVATCHRWFIVCWRCVWMLSLSISTMLSSGCCCWIMVVVVALVLMCE